MAFLINARESTPCFTPHTIKTRFPIRSIDRSSTSLWPSPTLTKLIHFKSAFVSQLGLSLVRLALASGGRPVPSQTPIPTNKCVIQLENATMQICRCRKEKLFNVPIPLEFYLLHVRFRKGELNGRRVLDDRSRNFRSDETRSINL